MKKPHIALAFLAGLLSVGPAFAETTPPESASAPKRPFFRLTTTRDREAPEPSAPTPVVAQAPVALTQEPGKPSAALAAEREQDMFGKMDAAVQQVAGLYGNPRFVRLMTNDPAAADQFKARLDLTKARETLAAEVTDLEKKKAALDSEIAIREQTLADMDGRLIRARAALDAFGKAGDEMKRMIEDAAK
jgi:hypothetical protein